MLKVLTCSPDACGPPRSSCDACVCDGSVKSVKSQSEPCVSAPIRSDSSVSRNVSVCELGPYASTLISCAAWSRRFAFGLRAARLKSHQRTRYTRILQPARRAPLRRSTPVAERHISINHHLFFRHSRSHVAPKWRRIRTGRPLIPHSVDGFLFLACFPATRRGADKRRCGEHVQDVRHARRIR